MDEIITLFVKRENNAILNKFKHEFDESLLSNPGILSLSNFNSTYLEKIFGDFLRDIIYEDGFAPFKLFMDHVNKHIIKLFKKHYSSSVDGNLGNFVCGVRSKIGISRQNCFVEFLSVCWNPQPEQRPLNEDMKYSNFVDVVKQEVAHESDELIGRVHQILGEVQNMANELLNLHKKSNRLVMKQQNSHVTEKKRLYKRLKTRHEEVLSNLSSNFSSHNQIDQLTKEWN